jgi:hypothetical protein
MARSLCSFFIDDTAAAALAARVPSADWNSGGTIAGSCSPGIGISTQNPNLEEQLPNWTLLDQHGNPRNAQIGQHIGGPGISAAGTSSGQEGTLPDATIRLYDVDAMDGTGELTLPADGASLVDLAVGWAPQVP